MVLNERITLISSIVFFSFSLVKVIQVFCIPANINIRKTILTYLLIYGSAVSVLEIYQGRNLPNYGISPSIAIGATIGAIAGYYSGYQICILVNLLAKNSIIESSSISVTLSFAFAEVGRLLGCILGRVILSN